MHAPCSCMPLRVTHLDTLICHASWHPSSYVSFTLLHSKTWIVLHSKTGIVCAISTGRTPRKPEAQPFIRDSFYVLPVAAGFVITSAWEPRGFQGWASLSSTLR